MKPPKCRCGAKLVSGPSGWLCLECDAKIVPYGKLAPPAHFDIWHSDTGKTVCDECDGTGKVECEYCDGGGWSECEHCGHECECAECDGEGEVECPECGGTGKVDSLVSVVGDA